MLNNDFVSIIVPVFNVEKYLSHCIDSILNQTYANFELILVDDGSTDNSGIICDEYATKDKRIKAFHKKNGGVSDSRNFGIDIASGKYLSFVDGDDLLDKRFLESLLKNIDGCQIAMCYFERFLDGAIVPTIKQNGRIDVVDEHGFWGKNYGVGIKASCCNKIFLASLFEKLRFDKNYSSAEDDLIIHRLTGQCKAISIVHEPLYFYRMRHDSITHIRSNNEMIKFQIIVYLDRCYYYASKGDSLLLEKWYVKCFDLLIKNYRKFNLAKERAGLKQVYKLRKNEYGLKSKTENLFFSNTHLYYFLSALFKNKSTVRSNNG